MEKLGLLILLSIITLSASEYPKYKVRGPISPPRPHHHIHAQFATKKWHQAPVKRHYPNHHPMPIRSRPIPVHMPIQHKIPIGIHPSINNKRPVAPPVRNFWKNTQTFKAPIEKPFIHHQPLNIAPEKFLSSPPIKTQEYDYHIQSNSIPIQANTIKQVGEKGPIHTIPAPNLSLKDKPAVIERVKSQNNHYHQPEAETTSYVQIQKAHQYQVTESSEPAPNQQQQYQNYQTGAYLQNQQYKSNLQTPSVLGQEQIILQQQHSDVDPNLYNILKAYPRQDEILETYTVPVLQQSQYLQSVPDLSVLSAQQNYAQISSDKSNKPEYQSFNYEEQNQNNKVLTSTYNIEPQNEDENSAPIISRKVYDSLAQSEYVQNYFDTSQSNSATEPDAKPSEDKSKTSNSNEEGSEFYVSLPNKEAAETLASLQAAGKINSNLMEMSKKNQNVMKIYVPDNQNGENEGVDEVSFDSNVKGEEYDDYPQDDADQDSQHDDSFGQKIQQAN